MPDLAPVRVRFAPSPTGYLHIGGARTALFNWILARKTGGRFILRVEDTDAGRSRPEYERVIVDELRWLGIDWDEGIEVGGPHAPYRQTERLPLYHDYARRLVESGRAYRCTCTKERLDALRDAQRARKENPGYDGHCRDRQLGPDCGPHVLRLRLPPGQTVVDDLVKGPVVYENAELDDFILVRPDGMPMYNFSVVVDDVQMGMTHVLRGDEHLNNTPKQLLIYEALGVAPPRFGHMPLILALDGSKMSKRHGHTSVGAYRELGVHPEALLNYLARLGWSAPKGDMEFFSVDELREAFTLDGIGKTGAKWDLEKLLWINGQWMKTLPLEVVAERARPFFVAEGVTPGERFSAAVASLRERHRTLVDLARAGRFYYDDALAWDEEARSTILLPAAALVGGVLEGLAALDDWSEAAIEARVNAYCAEAGVKLGKVAQPLRVALTGHRVGPGVFQALHVLGRERAIARLRAATA